MADHRFSEFHCNKLPGEPNAVIAVANEMRPDGTATQYVGSDGKNLKESLSEHIKLGDPLENLGPVVHGKTNPDVQKTGEDLVKACRSTLNMKP